MTGAAARAGENVLGAIIADGWYAGFVGFDAKRAGAHYGTAPELLAQLVITFDDGSRDQWIVTDGQLAGRRRPRSGTRTCSWAKSTTCALSARGWDAPGFDAAGWRAVRLPAADDRAARRRPGPPVRVTAGDHGPQASPAMTAGGTSSTSART